MSLTASDIIESISVSELYNTGMFSSKDEDSLSTFSSSKNEKRMYGFINQAVGMLYRKFPIKMKSVWLELRRDRLDYLLQGQQPYLCQGFTQLDLSNFKPYPIDEYGIPKVPRRHNWDDDLKTVRFVTTIDAHRLPINVRGHSKSVFLSSYNQLTVNGLYNHKHLHIFYDCKAPKISSPTDDTGLPETVLSAVKYYIARLYYISVTTNEGIKKFQFYTQEFQSAISEIEAKGYFESFDMFYNREVLTGKWN